ncbi:cytochrome c oxidase subunit II [Halobacteriales archaeon Cl-PHB]
MNERRAGLVALFGVALSFLAVDPVLAQSADTTTEGLIRGLNSWLLYLAVPIAVLVEGILIYTVWKYSKNDDPLPTMENRRLEIVWTIATAIVLVAVGIGSYQVLASPYVSADSGQQIDDAQEPYEVQVVAQRYSWTFIYPNETVAEFTGEEASVRSSNTLVLPNDRPVELNVTSRDWLHSFHVPGMGLKQDAFPGQHNTLLTKPTDTGEYQLYCAEYCGTGHSQMLGTVDVRSEQAFTDWLGNQTGS